MSLLESPGGLPAAFNRRAFRIHHHLCGHPLFALPRLVGLARALPVESVEYNAGDLPRGQDPTRTPRNGLSVDETVRRIADCRSWMVLKNVERDPAYGRLLEACLDEVARWSEGALPSMSDKQAFVFLSSPGAVTPYHMDPELNFLLQIQGSKRVHVWDPGDRRAVPENELERFYNGGHRNLPWHDGLESRAVTFELSPGDGLHIPVTAPHVVDNGGEVSISFSITFQTPAARRREKVFKVNARLRRLGWRPHPVGTARLGDAVKLAAFETVRSAKRTLDNLSRLSRAFRRG